MRGHVLRLASPAGRPDAGAPARGAAAGRRAGRGLRPVADGAGRALSLATPDDVLDRGLERLVAAALGLTSSGEEARIASSIALAGPTGRQEAEGLMQHLSVGGRRRPQSISLVALFVALGGTGYAAVHACTEEQRRLHAGDQRLAAEGRPVEEGGCGAQGKPRRAGTGRRRRRGRRGRCGGCGRPGGCDRPGRRSRAGNRPCRWCAFRQLSEPGPLRRSRRGTRSTLRRQPTFQNGWSNFAGFSTMAFAKDSAGFVHLKGTITGRYLRGAGLHASGGVPARAKSGGARRDSARRDHSHDGRRSRSFRAAQRRIAASTASCSRPAPDRSFVIEGRRPAPLAWRGPESNRRHHGFQPCALPTELPRRRRSVAARPC